MTGTYIRYAERSLRGEKLALVQLLAEMADDYEAAGHVLTVRQAYYQLVSHHGYPNQAGAYDRVQTAISDGRMAGLISWTAFEDRGRRLLGLRTEKSPVHAVERLAGRPGAPEDGGWRGSYRLDLWAGQAIRPEVWIEKQALEGVIENICSRLRVDFYAQKGYNSQSEAWAAGRRFAARLQRGQRTVVIHLGDHDPSGLDMTRDNHERLSLFAGYPVPVDRIALNMDQVEEYSLPENSDNRPKRGDARTAGYLERYGDMGWELDALPSRVIEEMIERAVLRVRDPALWDAALLEEQQDIRQLQEVVRDLRGDDPELSSGPSSG